MSNISDIDCVFDVTEDGRIFDRNLKEDFSRLKEGRYILNVSRVRHQRSKDQNNAMWGIPYKYFKAALHDSGNFKNPSNETVHLFCMVNCLPDEYVYRLRENYKFKEGVTNIVTGEIYKPPFRLTTTKLTTREAAEYYENMQQFYAENFSTGEKDFIPDPDPNKRKC